MQIINCTWCTRCCIKARKDTRRQKNRKFYTTTPEYDTDVRWCSALVNGLHVGLPSGNIEHRREFLPIGGCFTLAMMWSTVRRSCGLRYSRWLRSGWGCMIGSDHGGYWGWYGGNGWRSAAIEQHVRRFRNDRRLANFTDFVVIEFPPTCTRCQHTVSRGSSCKQRRTGKPSTKIARIKAAGWSFSEGQPTPSLSATVLGERCKPHQRRLGQSPIENRIWCIWWQQIYCDAWGSAEKISQNNWNIVTVSSGPIRTTQLVQFSSVNNRPKPQLYGTKSWWEAAAE